MDIKPFLGLGGVLVLAMATEWNDQVAAVAIADVRGGFDISHDAGTWIESLYLSAQIVGMAISPWLAVTFTLRRYAMFVAALAGISSVLIPLSPNIEAIDTLRTLQGLSGGMAIPLLMTTALRVLTPEIRLYGLAVYALTATFTPALATTFAALWTDLVAWQFIFLQPIPLCTLSLLLLWFGMPQDEPNYDRFRMLDWRGLLLIVVGFGSLSTFLYQGDRYDWFNSQTICVLGLVSVGAIPLLLVNEFFHPLPLLKLQLLARRNIAYGGLALFTFLILGQSGSTLPAQYLAGVAGFRPNQIAGLTLVIAMAQLVMLPAIAVLLNYEWVDARWVHLIGLMIIVVSCVGSSFLTIDWQAAQFLFWQGLQAVGQPMVVMSLLLLATNSVKPEEGPFASALVNTPRALAEVTAACLLDLIMRWRGGLHYNRIVDQIGQNAGRLPLPGGPGGAAQVVQQQSTILTLSDAYLIFAMIAFALAVVCLVLPQRTLPPRLQLAKH